MSSTDDRIVKMQFDNAQFKKGAAETKADLAALNKSVDSTGKSKGLLDLNSNMQRVQASASKMSVVTVTALATITNKAVNAGISLVKSLTFDPIRQGFSEYESMLTKQNTIMNATGKSAKVVKATLNELNRYSDQTIYSFGNMTDAITKFVNAGVPLDRAVVSIKGIANAAAFAGASSEEANRAMYAFSQSMSLGFIQLQDWNQIENANMGTQEFKNQLIQAGVAAGTLTKRGKEFVTSSGRVVSATKGWRDGLQDQWATTQVLNTALGKYADRSTTLGKKAFAAAQQVRTFSAFMDTLKESIGSGWSQIFTSLIGNLGQSTKLWTGLSNAVGGAVKGFFNFASAALKTWRKMGGFEKTIQGFKNLLAPIGALFEAVGAAWQAAFPSSGGKSAGKVLYSMSSGFEAVTRPLQLLADLIRGTAPVLATFFRAIHIGVSVLSGAGGLIVDFVKHLIELAKVKAPSSGGLVKFVKDLAHQIANAVGKIDELLQKGHSLAGAFGGVSDIKLPSMPSMPSMPKMSVPGGDGATSKVAGLAAGVKNLASNVLGLNKASAETTKTGVFDASGAPQSRMEAMVSQFHDFSGQVKDEGSNLADTGKKVGSVIGDIVGYIKNLVSGITITDIVSAFNQAIFATFALSIIKFVRTMSKTFEGFMGVGEAFNGLMEGAGGALKSFQTQARAKLILNIAIALLLLAAAMWVLSKIPLERLATGLVVIGGSFYLMAKLMSSLGDTIEKMDGAKAGFKMLTLAAAILALAAAMVLLAIAFRIMNKVDWQSVVKGLITMAAAMKALKMLGDMAKGSARNMLGGAVAIALIAGAMIILAGALLLFKLVDWGSMAKAGVALAGITLAVGALALIPYQGIAKVGAAMLMASVGMLAIANALVIFALVKWESIGKAAVVLALLTASLAILMAVGGPASAAAMIGLAGAMVLLAGACLMLNSVNWESIGKAAVVLTVLLAALAVGAVIMTAFLYAIAPVAPVLIILAAGFALLGVGLLAFSAAMAVAISLGAAGVAAFSALATGAAVAVAVFLQTLAQEAPVMKKAFLKILEEMIDALVQAVPMIIRGIKDMWAAVKVELFGKDKPKQMQDGGKSWVAKIADGIQNKMPAIVDRGVILATAFINGMAKSADKLAAAGVNLVAKIINGMASKLGAITTASGNLIIAWIKGITTQEARIAHAAVQAVIGMINAMAEEIRHSGPQLGGAMGNLGVAMVQGLIGGIGSMFGQAMGAIEGLASGMVNKAKSILKIFSPSKVFNSIGQFLVQGLTQGIQNNAASAISAVASLVSGQIAVANELVSKYIQTLDQQALAARAKADGLAAAAKQAQAAANKTKGKKDDRAADRLGARADAAAKAADAAEKKAQASKNAQDRKEQFDKADSLGKAKMRSEDAANQLEAAKAAERRAEADRIQADALIQQSKAADVTAKQRKAMRKQAAALRAQAAKEAAAANTQLNNARNSAADALAWQKKAGEEAAKGFQNQFDAEAQAAKDADAFEKMTAEEKAAKRRADAKVLEDKAAKDLADAKRLAFTDLEAANALAEQAMNEADQARQFITDAIGFEGGGSALGVVDIQPTEAAAIAFQQYADLYDSAVAAAAAGTTLEFNQYNTSPESLSPTEVYRQTNNLLTYAADKVSPAA